MSPGTCPQCEHVNEDINGGFCEECGAMIKSGSSATRNLIIFLVGFIVVGMLINFLDRKTTPKAPPPQRAVAVPPEIEHLTPTPAFYAEKIKVIKSNWYRSGFDAVAMWDVKLKNTSDVTLGDIEYETTYYSETNNLVDSGRGTIQKLIKPGQTRTFEVNDGFLHKEAAGAYFVVKGARVIP